MLHNHLQKAFTALQDQWEKSPQDHQEILALLWLFQDQIRPFVEDGKAELRENGSGSYRTQLGDFVVTPAKTEYLLSKEKSAKIRSRLGAYFWTLFREEYQTLPKFEEVFSGLSSEHKDILLSGLTQRNHKPRVTLVLKQFSEAQEKGGEE